MKKRKKLLVVGTKSRLENFSRHKGHFEFNDEWEVVECCGIEEAREHEEANALVVLANKSDYLIEHSRWPDHPPTVWFCVGGSMDVSPGGVVRIHGGVSTPALFKQVICLAR